jgi:hypothetical protein
MTVAERNRSLDAERALGVALEDYAGQWVGVVEHAVMASAPTLEQLVEQIEAQEIQEVDVFRVPEESSSACFF